MKGQTFLTHGELTVYGQSGAVEQLGETEMATAAGKSGACGCGTKPAAAS